MDNADSAEKYLNKAAFFKRQATAYSDLCQAFYAFTEKHKLTEIQPSCRVDAVTKLLKMYEITDVDSIEMLDISSEQALTTEQWDSVKKRIWQSHH